MSAKSPAVRALAHEYRRATSAHLRIAVEYRSFADDWGAGGASNDAGRAAAPRSPRCPRAARSGRRAHGDAGATLRVALVAREPTPAEDVRRWWDR